MTRIVTRVVLAKPRSPGGRSPSANSRTAVLSGTGASPHNGNGRPLPVHAIVDCAHLFEHPFVERFTAPIADDDYQAVRADVAYTKKFPNPVLVYEGKVLVRSYYAKIARELGLPLPGIEFHGTAAEAQDQLYSAAQGPNYSDGQKDWAAIEQIEAIANDPLFERPPHVRAIAIAAKQWGRSPRQLKYAASAKRMNPEGFARLRFDRKSNVNKVRAEGIRRAKQKDLKARADAARKQLFSTGAKQPWEIVHGDALEALRSCQLLPRLIFTDPRYNLRLDYGQGKEADSTSEPDYLAWCKTWIDLCASRLANDGSMLVMTDVRHQADFWKMMQAADLSFRTTILWYEEFGSYNPLTFTPRFRFIHYFTKHPKRFVWNSDDILISSARELVYKDPRRVRSGMVPPNVWDNIPRLVGCADERMPEFPTQLPLELVDRIVKVASDPGDLVLDHFSGSGSTGEAAIRNGRKYLGIEIVERNVDWSRHRLTVVSDELRRAANAKTPKTGATP